MLSILIPTYNFDCTQLVQTLLQQLPEDAEIVVGDDKSTDLSTKQRLDALGRMNRVRLVQPTKNLGSAGMRNLLCKEAKGDYLLYIDCDAIVEENDFIKNYLKELDGSVVCGTVLHPDVMPSPLQSLRWKYEKKMEKRFTADARNKDPYHHFRTFHFLVPKTIMEAIPFDEEIKRSGYEDLLFGKRLEENGIRVRHVNISATNGDIESNEVYLKKTEGHIQTLLQTEEKLKDYSTLLIYNRKLEKLFLGGVFSMLFKTFKHLMKRNLLSKQPRILVFQLYKLGLLREANNPS